MRNFLTYNIFLVIYKHLTITAIELLLAQCQDTAGLCETTEKILLRGETPSKSILLTDVKGETVKNRKCPLLNITYFVKIA